MTDFDSATHRPWYVTFHDLMLYRVREILLVSSPYDAFTLEEDGRLTERMHTDWFDSAPRITHVATGAGAMRLLETRHFDLVVTMVRIADIDVSEFGRRVKERWPELPLVLLVLTEADLNHFPGGVDPKAIDRVFAWTGDAKILLSIIKLVEDQKNVEHDTHVAGARVILVVEDSIRVYSSFLGQLYAELMAQSRSLTAEGINDLHRLMRRRTRAKVLLATTYEEAMAHYRRYPSNVVALITDVRFPRGGEEDGGAGFALVKQLRAELPELPVLVQSSELENAKGAAALGVHWVDKNSRTLLRDIRSFVTESLGFGDFVFRLPDRTEVARARSMYELETLLSTVPDASLVHHATGDHFSQWLMARSMFRLAAGLKRQKMERLGGVEGLREYLIASLRDARRQEAEGVISDFASTHGASEALFVRIGSESIGGKARGLAFINSRIAHERLTHRVPGLRIRVPRTVVLATSEFDRFMESNRILEGGLGKVGAAVIRERCLGGKLPDETARDLRAAVETMRGPLAVRSSSLLEDSQLQPFAGIYATYMLPNNAPDPNVRFEELCRAVRAIYASTYSDEAQAYISATPYSIEEEKMAVVIQEIVGTTHGQRFYPAISGVALSYNYYPFGSQRADDGLVMVALGLGQTIVQGGAVLQFSPVQPGVLPQFSTPADYLRFSQSRFFALDVSSPIVDFSRPAEDSLKEWDLDAAEEDGVLGLVGSVYNRDDDRICDGLATPGPRLVTFHDILRYDSMPLAAAMRTLLESFQRGLGCPVEIEFAIDSALSRRAGSTARSQTLHVLQVRPQATQHLDELDALENVSADELLCRTDRSMGHGAIETIRDLVVIERADLDSPDTPAIAQQVGELNLQLREAHAPYLLMGPGRWGSSDPRLGIPVKWSQINGARVILETSFAGREVEPSQGAHFFHNLTSFRIGYLTLFGLDQPANVGRRFFDAAWLARQPTVRRVGEARHIRLEHPLRVCLDGKRGTATIHKPRG